MTNETHWPLILGYHSINDNREDGLAVKASDFERQIAWLHRKRYRSSTLADFAKGLAERGEQTVVITFDDGYADNYTVAFPILKRYGFVATVFLVSDYVGQKHVFWWDTSKIQAPGQESWYYPLNWSQIAEMKEHGIEFGSHTCTHPPRLTVLSDRQRWEEVHRSRQELEARLGCEVSSFCYPRGDLDARLIGMVERAGYRTAVVTPPSTRNPFLALHTQANQHLPAQLQTGFPAQNLVICA
jgi:peptidoglycan/xylan/chitin deacetylase (PgdA/CDA1 family)